MRVLERWGERPLARIVLIFLAGASVAQASPVASQSPGAPQQQFADPVQLELDGQRVTGSNDSVPNGGLDAETAAVEIQLQKVEFVGVTRFETSELHTDWATLVGQKVTVAKIYAKTNELRADYRNAGYLLAQVVTKIDPEAGVVTIDVVEGDIGTVAFRRGVSGRDGMLDAIGERIADSSPLDINVLERELLRLNDLPGVTAYVIPEGPQVVGQNARLNVYMDHKTIDFEVGIRNRASELIGPEQYDLTWNFNSLFRAYENTQLRFVTSGDERLRFGSIDHTQVLGSRGTRLTVSYATSSSEPDLGADFSQFNLVTDNDSASIGLTIPVKRSRVSNLSLRTRLTYQESATDETGFVLTEDNIAALRVGVTYDRLDQWFGGRGLNLIDFEISQGLDILSSSEPDSPLSSRSGGQPEFTKATLYFARVQSLGGRFSLLVALNGQYGFRNLMSPEEFAYGGEYFGRAYDASELVGDHGYAGKAEFRLSTGGERNSATWYAFYDAGRVVQRFGPGEEGSKPRRQSASAAGAGVRFTLFGALSGYLEAAEPLSDVVAAEGNDDTRFFGGLKLKF